MADKNIPASVHVEHVQKRQFKYYNLMVIGAMCFASMGMGYSASIIGTTLGILKRSLFFSISWTLRNSDLIELMQHSATIFPSLFQARHPSGCSFLDIDYEWAIPSRSILRLDRYQRRRRQIWPEDVNHGTMCSRPHLWSLSGWIRQCRHVHCLPILLWNGLLVAPGIRTSLDV